MLFDTHAHLNFSAFKDDADEVIRRSLDYGMNIINVGSQFSTSARAVEYAEKYDGLYAAIGLHPIHIERKNFAYKDSEELEEMEISGNGEDFDFEKYLELVKRPKVAAIGEMGLDYHHFDPSDDIPKLISAQKKVLMDGIKLANTVEKPMMIHCWDAYDDLYGILQNNPVKKAAVIHSFVGGYKTARKFIELGYKIGLNGIITYGISYDKLIKEIDLKDILLETDCPYLTPVPKKGERNEPIFVQYVAQKIAQIKEMAIKKVEETTTDNARRLFEI